MKLVEQLLYLQLWRSILEQRLRDLDSKYHDPKTATELGAFYGKLHRTEFELYEIELQIEQLSDRMN